MVTSQYFDPSHSHKFCTSKKLYMTGNVVRIEMPAALFSWWFRYLHVSSYMTGIHRPLLSSARRVQTLSGKKEQYKKMNRVTATYNAFPFRALLVAFGNVVAPNILKQAYSWPLILPVHECSLVLLMHTNKLDMS